MRSSWPCSARSASGSALTPACLHADDGLLFRLPAMDEPPLDLFDGLTGELAERADPRGAARDRACSACDFARMPPGRS